MPIEGAYCNSLVLLCLPIGQFVKNSHISSVQ